MLSTLRRSHCSLLPPATCQPRLASASTHRSLSSRAMSSAATSAAPCIVMDPFCLRSFSPSHASSTHISSSADDFVQRVNEHYQQQRSAGVGEDRALRDGYAPFCKHLFMPNHLADLHSAYLPITDDNRHHLQSEYVARTEKELPVLMRFFPKDKVKPVPATWLDVILYSRQQIAKENAAMQTAPATAPTAELPPLAPHLSTASTAAEWQWGIVSIKPQTDRSEIAMLPITMMRNALGVEEGGSGVPLDRTKYLQSVQFWDKHANVQ